MRNVKYWQLLLKNIIESYNNGLSELLLVQFWRAGENQRKFDTKQTSKAFEPHDKIFQKGRFNFCLFC